MLEQTRPLLAIRDCRHCWRFVYNETNEKGRPIDRPYEFRKGQLIKRKPGLSSPACTQEGGCSKGDIDNQRTLHPITERAYRYYRECRAVGIFPHDAVVRHFAVLFREAEDYVDRRTR